jgi:hypothetical protein
LPYLAALLPGKLCSPLPGGENITLQIIIRTGLGGDLIAAIVQFVELTNIVGNTKALSQ